MVSFLPDSIPVPLWLSAIIVVGFILETCVLGFLALFAFQIPDVMAQLTSQIKKRGLVMMHYTNNRAKFFCPKRNGKKGQENTLDLPGEVGVKFDPSGSGASEVLDKSTLYHYYTKANTAITAKYAKAIHDFYTFCGEKGITVNKELIDVLVVENLDIQGVYTQPLLEKVMKNLPLPIRTEEEQWLNDDVLLAKRNRLLLYLEELENKNTSEMNELELSELEDEIKSTNDGLEFIKVKYADLDKLQKMKHELQAIENNIEDYQKKKAELIDGIDIITGYLDPETRERMYTLKSLQDDLKKLVITDDQFVFSTVHDFVFAASSLNSAGMTESINIARSDALEQNRNDDRGFTMQAIFAGVIIVVILFFGLALAYKVGFT
jgi:hypothetical protein